MKNRILFGLFDKNRYSDQSSILSIGYCLSEWALTSDNTALAIGVRHLETISHECSDGRAIYI